MVARVCAVAIDGVRGRLVEVEADLVAGLPGLTFSGRAGATVEQARARVKPAIVNTGEEWPQRHITINLRPADLLKEGAGFDLPVAVAVLAAAGRVPEAALDGVLLYGELGLDGRLWGLRGVLPAVVAAAEAGLRGVIVPADNAAEAALVPGLRIGAPATLGELLAHLRGQQPLPVVPPTRPRPAGRLAAPDLADVRGQSGARRALEVAAAGGHHLLLTGPPGVGKTMLAERLPGLLPPLSRAQALETTAIASVAGKLPAGQPLVQAPPFRAVHHTISPVALVGGGSGRITPGEVSLAHNGVLMMDEAPECKQHTLDTLRQPLEQGQVTVSRASGTVTFPARFQLVLAANPCPCGSGMREAGGLSPLCSCAPADRRRYQGRLSGPLLDRVDLRVSLAPVGRHDLLGVHVGAETSATVAERVVAARRRAAARWSAEGWTVNAQVPGPVLRGRWRPDDAALRDVTLALETGQLTGRGFDRVLRVAWTLADLSGDERPQAGHVDEALHLRGAA